MTTGATGDEEDEHGLLADGEFGLSSGGDFTSGEKSAGVGGGSVAAITACTFESGTGADIAK